MRRIIADIPQKALYLMSLMDLRGRGEKGLETTDTKETSLRDRYFSKSSRTDPSEDATHNKNSLKRDTHVVLEREGDQKPDALPSSVGID